MVGFPVVMVTCVAFLGTSLGTERVKAAPPILVLCTMGSEVSQEAGSLIGTGLASQAHSCSYFQDLCALSGFTSLSLSF